MLIGNTPIIDLLKSANIELQDIDLEIYAEMHAEFINCTKQTGKNGEYATLFANLLFLLTNKATLDYLLSHLEADVRMLWEGESKHSLSQLALHQPKKSIEFFGLTWPVPEPSLAENRSNHLLSRALLKTEQAHGMNLGDLESAPVPTFVGFVSQAKANEVIQSHRLWNEESKLSALFYHGKMTHRIQCCLIMKAVELKLLDIGEMSIPQLISILTSIKMGQPQKLVWDLILDNIVCLRNIMTYNIKLDPISALQKHFPPVNIGNEYQTRYLYACDPYFFHSYLMSASRIHTPYLSECVTQMFAKSAFAIQRLERKLGQKYAVDTYVRTIRDCNLFEKTALTWSDLRIEEVLRRQAFCFADAGAHLLDASDIATDQRARGKETSIRNSGTVKVQYRSLISKEKGDSWFQLFKRATLPVVMQVTEAASHIFK